MLHSDRHGFHGRDHWKRSCLVVASIVLLGLGFDMPISNNATFGVSVDYQHFFFKVGDVDGGGSLNLLAHLRV